MLPRSLIVMLGSAGLVALAPPPTLSASATTPEAPHMLIWSGFGSAPGQFNSPVGVATDELGNVHVLEQANARVQKFDRYGNFMTQTSWCRRWST